jgi:hypothetical protein
VGVPAVRPPAWQRAQAVAAWAPVSGKRVVLWSMPVAGRQPLVVWQPSQALENPPDVCTGRRAAWKACAWQLAHAVDVVA